MHDIDDYDRKREHRFVNQWTSEREFWLTPSISVSFYDGFCLDISFLCFKYYTFLNYNRKSDNGEKYDL
jgi:hypothetical protein